MTNSGKVLFGGEALERNTDSTPGLDRGEIRYFLNEPNDPRWLKCDGGIHKRSSYPEYSLSRLKSGLRFDFSATADMAPNFLESLLDLVNHFVIPSAPTKLLRIDENTFEIYLVDFSDIENITEALVASPPSRICAFWQFPESGRICGIGLADYVIFSDDEGQTWDDVGTVIDEGYGFMINPYSKIDLTHLQSKGIFIYPLPHHNKVATTNNGTSWSLHSIDSSNTVKFSRDAFLSPYIQNTGSGWLKYNFANNDGVPVFAFEDNSDYEPDPYGKVCINPPNFNTELGAYVNMLPGHAEYWVEVADSFHTNKLILPYNSTNINPGYYCTVEDRSIYADIESFWWTPILGFGWVDEFGIEFFSLASHQDIPDIILNANSLWMGSEFANSLYTTDNNQYMALWDKDWNNQILARVWLDPEYFHAPGLKKVGNTTPYVWTGE